MAVVNQLAKTGSQHQERSVLVLEDLKGKRIINLDKNIYSLGRDSRNSITITSPLVSRHHATLLRLTSTESHEDLFQIIDGDLQGTRSTNGLIVNGKKCLYRSLEHKDYIVFGGHAKASYLIVNSELSELQILECYENKVLENDLHEVVDPFATLVPSEIEVKPLNEAALLRLASFPELLPSPIIEIDLIGKITYLNPAAIQQFPNIQKPNISHSIIEGLLEEVKINQKVFFVRDIQVKNTIFEQYVYYIPESRLIRSYLIDITKRKQREEELQHHRENLEHLVEERTASLKAINQQLQWEIHERSRIELELRQSEEKFRKLAHREKLLNRLVNQIRNSIDLDTILATAISEIRNLLQVERSQFIWYFPQSSNPSFYITHEDCEKNSNSSLGEYLIADPENIYLNTLFKGETVRIDDLRTDTILDPQMRSRLIELGFTSYLSSPLQIDNSRLGIISCAHCDPSRSWHDEEVEILQAISNELVIELTQSQLYEQSRSTAVTAQAQASQLQQALHQLQQTQAQLIQSEKMSSLGQMVAGIAHEINNPVNFIHGNLSYIKQYTEELLEMVRLYKQFCPNIEPKILEFSDKIDLEFLAEDLPKILYSMNIGTERICQIVLSLRNFSRLDEADMKFVDIHEGIDSTLLILQNRLKSKPDRPAISVIKEYDKLPQVECYPGQLNQVLMNILSNGIDALDSYNEQRTTVEILANPSTIKIRTQVIDGNYVMIRIADNGSGMKKDVKTRLFDPFFTTKPVGKGTGLGLSISYQIIVEKHGGLLWCESELGKGAEFCIKIPIKQT